jgi:hypothetical protein
VVSKAGSALTVGEWVQWSLRYAEKNTIVAVQRLIEADPAVCGLIWRISE